MEKPNNNSSNLPLFMFSHPCNTVHSADQGGGGDGGGARAGPAGGVLAVLPCPGVGDAVPLPGAAVTAAQAIGALPLRLQPRSQIKAFA